MWYFAWILGLGFAVLLAIVNAIWLEYGQDRNDAFGKPIDENQNPTVDDTSK